MMSNVTPAPALNESDLDGYYDKFFIEDASEILHHLQRLGAVHCALTARADGGADSISTMLLNVDATSLWVDVPANRTLLDAWLSAHHLRFEGSLDRAALRFSCSSGSLDSHEDRPALRLPIPVRILYLQRREFMRREPPIGRLVCHLRLEDGSEVEATIRDIGGGGLAIVAIRTAVKFSIGDVLAGCRIVLPEIGELEVSLQVRHVLARVSLGDEATQIGCEFSALAPAAQSKLFRYLLQLDRDQLARRRRNE